MTLLDQGYQKRKKFGFLELKKNSQMFYSAVKSRFSPILELRKNAQIGKFSFFVKISKSDFLALIRRFWYLMTLLDQGYQKIKKFGFLELKKNCQIFYSTVKSRFSPILELRKNAQIGKFSFFVKIPKSDFLALICRFWYLMTLLDQGYQKTKKFGFLELKKNSQIFYSTVKSRFSPILELRKNA